MRGQFLDVAAEWIRRLWFRYSIGTHCSISVLARFRSQKVSYGFDELIGEAKLQVISIAKISHQDGSANSSSARSVVSLM